MLLMPAFFLSLAASVCAQVKIGNHPTTINKASLLELESDSLGLLLPRLKDTVSINSLNPPDGMMIYLIDASARQHLYVRKYGSWSEMGNSSGFNLTNGLKSDSVVTTLNGVLRKISIDSIVANSINNNTTVVTNVINTASSFNLTNGLKSDSVVTTLNGALRKVRMDSLVANSITNNTTLVTNVINNASSFKLTNGVKTDSVVTTLNGALRKVSVDSLMNSSVKLASGYMEPVQVIQAAIGASVFGASASYSGGAAAFANNEVKKFIYAVPGAKQGDVVTVSTVYGFSDALFIAKSVVSAADAVEVTIINGTPDAVSSLVQMSIGLIRK